VSDPHKHIHTSTACPNELLWRECTTTGGCCRIIRRPDVHFSTFRDALQVNPNAVHGRHKGCNPSALSARQWQAIPTPCGNSDARSGSSPANPSQRASGLALRLACNSEVDQRSLSPNVNKLFGANGPVWQEESFDHVLRSQESLAEKLEYIRQNPVRRGLVKRPEGYRWLWVEQGPG